MGLAGAVAPHESMSPVSRLSRWMDGCGKSVSPSARWLVHSPLAVLSPLAGSDTLSRWVHFKRPRPITDLILLVITCTIQV